MAPTRPELVFAAGPQAGQRTVLESDVVILGRGAGADIHLAESYASRRHLRFELTADGWLVELLSSGGTQINEKTYKAGKRLLLDTGDIIGLGAETQILYVAPGGDPDAALAAWQAARPAAVAPSEIPEEPKEVTPESTPKATPRALSGRTAPVPKAGLSKMSKYLLGAVVYLGLLAGVVVVLTQLKSDNGDGPLRRRLTPEVIAEVIGEPLEQPRDVAKAAEALRAARDLYPGTFAVGDLYRCVKNYKLHLAYRNRSEYDDVEDAQHANEVTKDLIELVADRYNGAYVLEKAQQWHKAREAYNELLAIVPERSQDSAVYQRLVTVFHQHAAYVARQIKQKR